MKEENKKSSVIILLLVILIAILIVGIVYLIKNPKIEYVEVQESAEMKENNATEVAKTTYTYEDISGTYEFEKEFKIESDGDIIEGGGKIKLYLTDDGMYYYNKCEDINSGHSGYYYISNNKIILNELFSHGNDAALCIRDVKDAYDDKCVELTINDDKTITLNNCDDIFYEVKSVILTKKSNEANYDISAELINAINYDCIISPDTEIPEKFLKCLHE